jgi:hypothetical protein
MAWYTINYVCGHTGSEQLYGKTSDRQSRIAWAERNKMCPDCYQKERDRERLEATAKAMEANADLPALKGSIAQVAWAERIRATAKGCIELAVGGYKGQVPTEQEMIDQALTMLKRDDAKYWIDYRDELTTVSGCLARMARKIAERRAREEGKAVLGLR